MSVRAHLVIYLVIYCVRLTTYIICISLLLRICSTHVRVGVRVRVRVRVRLCSPPRRSVPPGRTCQRSLVRVRVRAWAGVRVRVRVKVGSKSTC